MCFMENLNLHHIGIVTKDIGKYIASQPLQECSRIMEDKNQDAFIAFLKTGSDTLLELVQPLSERSQTYAFSKKGGGYHHLCYQVKTMFDFEKIVKEHRLMKISRPVPALAMGNCMIVFCFTREKQLIEFVISAAEVPIQWL
jgi:methylmalonyl-CoA/ethylmalonyl-CoA epimerase